MTGTGARLRFRDQLFLQERSDNVCNPQVDLKPQLQDIRSKAVVAAEYRCQHKLKQANNQQVENRHNQSSSTAESKTMDKNVKDPIVNRKMRLELKHKYNLKELTIPLERIEHETEATIKIEAPDDNNYPPHEPISNLSKGQKTTLHQQDENDEELFKLEQMFSLNEFTFSVEVASKCNDVSADDGPKRTRSGRLIQITSKLQSEADNETAAIAALIDSEHENSSDSIGSESSGSEFKSGTETESDESVSTLREKQNPKITPKSKYPCDNCPKVCTSPNLLEQHQNTHEGLEQFHCSETNCGFKTTTKMYLRKHKQRHHSTSKFQCDLCGKLFCSRLASRDHQNVHKIRECKARAKNKGENIGGGGGMNDEDVDPDLLDLKCDLCDNYYPSKRSLRKHKNFVHSKKKDRPIFTCQLCKKTFTSEPRFKRHHKVHDKTLVKGTKLKESVSCSTCHKMFTNSTSLKYHQLQVHSADFKFKCALPNCNYGAQIQSRLDRHMVDVHSDVRLFLCDECPHASKTAGNLKQHKNYVHPVSKDHICCICGKEFAVKSLLVAHEKTHGTSNEVDASPGTCDSCGAVFTSAQALRSHKRIHDREMVISNDKDNDSNDMKFSCSYCDQSFAFLNTMQLHERRAHFEKFRYKCDVCPYGTPTFSSMVNHKLANHSTERPFKCQMCGNCYKTPRDLNKHVKSRHPISKNHVCSECGKAFVHKSMLTAHQLGAHKIPRPMSSASSRLHAPNSSPQSDRTDQDSTFDYTSFHKEQNIYEAGLEHGNSDVATSRPRCPVCRRYFANQENMEKHKLKQHGPRKEAVVEKDEPKRVEFQCKECPSIFSAKRNLVIHMKVHDENYAKNHLTCSICERVFSSEQGLGRHSHKDVPA